MSIRKIMEQELNGLIENQEKYLGGESWNSKYWYYTFSGKISVLRHLLCYKYIKKKHVEEFRQEIQKKYKNIRMINKPGRNMHQTLEGIYLEAMLDIIDNGIVPVLFKKKQI